MVRERKNMIISCLDLFTVSVDNEEQVMEKIMVITITDVLIGF